MSAETPFTPPQSGPFGHYTRFANHVALATGIVIAVGLFMLVMWFALHVLLVVFAGVLLAIIVRAPADWLATYTRLSEGWALALVLVIMLGMLLAGGMWLAPEVTKQLGLAVEKLPESLQQARGWLEEYTLGRWLLETVPLSASAAEGQGFDVAAAEALGMGYTVVQVFVDVVILLAVAVYLAAEPHLYLTGLLRLIPKAQRPRAAEILGATAYTLRWWLIGTLIRMFVVGLMTFLALWALGAPLPFALAAVAFVLDFVPYFGPIVAAAPGVLLAFVGGPQLALYVALAYFAVQQIEGIILSPLLYHRTIYLPPVLTILAQLLLYGMVGALGVILATPLTAVALVWIKMLYVERLLGDSIKTPADDMDEEEIPPLPHQHEHENEPDLPVQE